MQDLLKVEAKLQERQLREKVEEERQMRIAAKLKEKVGGFTVNKSVTYHRIFQNP